MPRHLAARLGAAAGERLWSAIVDRNLDELDTLSPQLRYALLRRSVTQPPTETLRALVDWFANKWATRLSRIPILPVVAIVGVDERRRAAVVEAMLSKAPWMLPVISVEWRRQRLLSSPRRTAPRRGSDTTESPSGRRGRGASLRAIASYVREMSADWREAAQLRLRLHDEDTSDSPMGEPQASSLAGRLSRILPKQISTVTLVEEAASVPVRSAGVAEGRDEIRQTIRLSTASLVAVVVLPGQESDAADSIVRYIAEWMFSYGSGHPDDPGGHPRRRPDEGSFICLRVRTRSGSEPAVGWNWMRQMARFHEVWVGLTRANNRGVIGEFTKKTPLPNVDRPSTRPAGAAPSSEAGGDRPTCLLLPMAVVGVSPSARTA